MRSLKKNEFIVYPFIENRGRVRLTELENAFVSTTKMGKQTLYRTLKRLEDKGKIRREEQSTGNRKKVFYQTITFELVTPIKQFINKYKFNYSVNPSIEEIAISVGKSPQKIIDPLYEIAKDVGWELEGTSIKKNPNTLFGRSYDPINKQEVSVIVESIKYKLTQITSLNALLFVSYQQDILYYPHILKSLTEILKENDEQAISLILKIIYSILTSPRFLDRIDEKNFKKEYNILADTLLVIAKNKELKTDIRSDAILNLSIQKDERLIPLLVRELESFEKEDKFELKNCFERLVMSKFYKEYKIELLKESFELAKKNNGGANFLVGCLYKTFF